MPPAYAAGRFALMHLSGLARPHRAVLLRELVGDRPIFVNRVGILARTVTRRERAIVAPADLLAELVVHRAQALLEDPTAPARRVVGGDRNGMEMRHGERALRRIIVVAADRDHQAKRAIFLADLK